MITDTLTNVEKNVSLQSYNTFNINANCDYLAHITSIDNLQQLLADSNYKNMPRIILGGGSNILLTQDLNALVLKIDIKGHQLINQDAEHIWLKIGAGEVWHDIVTYCVEQRYYGIENLALIPGLCGAAPVQNIGAYGVELKDVFDSLTAVAIADGSIHTFNRDQCAFGYRDSIFKSDALRGQYVIVDITLKLNKHATLNTSYGALKENLQQKAITAATIDEVYQAVIDVRNSKLPDPKVIPNAGSFFKNPVINAAQFAALQTQYPNMPHYEMPDQHYKLAAAWLIDQCGFKGKRSAHAGVHDKQALVLINHNQASGAEIKALAEAIQQAVAQRFGVTITPEVNIL